MKTIFAIIAAVMLITVPALADDFPLVELKSPHGVTFSFYRSDVQNTVAVAVAFKGGLASDDMNGPATGLIAPGLLTTGAGGKSSAELFELFQDVGGRFSISSNPDQTYAELSAPSKGILGAAKLVNLVLTHPDFPEKKLVRERESFAQRLEEYAAYPDSKMQQAFAFAVSEPHPYQNYFNPSAEAVRRVMRADLMPWMAKHITKDGILVSIVGNLEPAEAEAIVDQMFDGLPEKSDIAPTPKMVFKVSPGLPTTLAVDTGDQAILTMGTAFTFNANLEEWASASMLSQIFAGDQKSHLFKDIREATGATYGMQPLVNFYEVSMLNAVTGRVAKTDLDKTVALVKKSWDQFRIKGPSDDDVTNAKASMAHYFGDLSRNHAAMAGFIRDYLTGHWTTAQIAGLPSLIHSMNLKDPPKLAKLFPENPIIVIAQ
jgi:zinc protease